MADKDIERQEILMEAKELGYSATDLNVLKEILEDVAGSWNGEDDRCIGTGHVGGEIITEEDATAAQELIEKIDAFHGI